MKDLKFYKEVGLGIVAWWIIYGALKLRGISIDYGLWIIILLLLLIYMKLIDIPGKKIELPRLPALSF